MNKNEWQQRADELNVQVEKTQNWLDENYHMIPYEVACTITAGIVSEKQTIENYERFAQEDAKKGES